MLSNILSNERYNGEIIHASIFKQAQTEKQRRSNQQKDENGIASRANTKYNSGSPFSGRIICAECGKPYRRITRTNHDESKEIVWRCASRIEHGSRFCKNSPTITESMFKKQIMDFLKIPSHDEKLVRENLGQIMVNANGGLVITQRESPQFDFEMLYKI